MALPRREDMPQPDAETVFGVIKRMKVEEPEVAQQLEVFFDLFRGFGVPMTFAPASLHALDEAFPALMEQLEAETGNTAEEGEDLMLIIQLCGFWLGTLLIEQLGGNWQHPEGEEDEEGSLIIGMDGVDEPYDPFDPFIKKANNPRVSIVKEVEKATHLPLKNLMED